MASIERRSNKDGISYRVIWRHDGERKTATWSTADKALRWKDLIEATKGDESKADRLLAQRMSTGPKMAEVFKHYMERHRATPYTLQNYSSYWRIHIGPAMADIPVDQLRADDIRTLVAVMEGNERASKTIHNVCGFLGQLLKHAVIYSWIEASPWDASLLPKKRAVKVERDHFLTLDETKLIIEAMSGHQDAARVMLATGLRPGELVALDVSDVNLTAKQPSLRVTKAMKQDLVNGEYLGDPKSKRSVRTVGLPPSTADTLRRLTAGRPPSDPVFTMRDGPGSTAETVRLRKSRLYKSWGTAVGKLRAGKKPPLTKKPALYALRHTHASLMLDAGMSIWQLSRHLGHASVSITETTYAHLMPDAHYQAAAFAAKAMGGDLPVAELEPA